VTCVCTAFLLGEVVAQLRRRARGTASPFGNGYACGHPAAEGFDDKRLPYKRQVPAGQYAALSRVMRAGTLADYAFG